MICSKVLTAQYTTSSRRTFGGQLWPTDSSVSIPEAGESCTAQGHKAGQAETGSPEEADWALPVFQHLCSLSLWPPTGRPDQISDGQTEVGTAWWSRQTGNSLVRSTTCWILQCSTDTEIVLHLETGLRFVYSFKNISTGKKRNHKHVWGCYRDQLNLVVRALVMRVLAQQEAPRDGQHTETELRETACFIGSKMATKNRLS